MDCRLCLNPIQARSNGILLIDIFPNKSSTLSATNRRSRHRITFLEAFNSCTQLNASLEDSLPQCLCKSCSGELELCYEFLLKAKSADFELRRQLQVKWTEQPDLEGGDNDDTETSLESDLDQAFEETAFLQCEKDPLEESEVDENEEKENKPDIDTTERDLKIDSKGDSDMKAATSDDEDNKPLKELLYEVTQSKIVVSQFETPTTLNHHANGNECFNTTQEEDDEDNDFDLSNSLTENMPDLSLSAEAQIFPQGRFKCQICGQTYFTTIGLQAHMEVHLPKSTTTKKKRVRGPNKKKRKAKSTTPQPQQQNELEDNEDIVVDETTNEELKTETTMAVAAAEADQSIPKTVRKARKEKLPKPKKIFPCHVCGKHMISASKLRYHMVMHTGEKDYLCTMCPKAYSTIYALKHHMRTHTGERPYECKFCGDRFTRPTTLKSHMRRHTGERPYGCEICGKRFIQHSSMTTHMKLNHMPKTIKCPHCDKKYARQTDLTTHLLSHTGDKPFSCQLCPSRFIRQANLNKHMNQHHASGGRPSTNAAKTTKKKLNTLKPASAAAQQKVNVKAVSPALSIGSCNVKLEFSSSSKLARNNNDTQLQLDEVTAAQYEGNSNRIIGSLTVNANNRDLLSDLPLTQAQPMDANIQQNLFDDSTRSIEDLNRWNWPNHS